MMDWNGGELDPDEYWDDLSTTIEVGDLFVDLPLLSRELQPITTEDERGATRAYLPTVNDLAVLFRKFRPSWWFLPVGTHEQLENAATFDHLLEHALAHQALGWFPLPPRAPNAPGLSEPALVYVVRPTIHRQELFEEVELERVARLTDRALDALGR